jgi:hypothetical protein
LEFSEQAADVFMIGLQHHDRVSRHRLSSVECLVRRRGYPAGPA